MSRRHQALQIRFRSKVAVQHVDILCPVAVVGFAKLVICRIDVLHNRRYPDRIEAHAFDVVELLFRSFPRPAAVSSVLGITCWRG